MKNYSKEQIKECRAEYSWHPREGKQACSSALPKLKEEWTCDDMAVYFDDAEDILSSDNSEAETDNTFPKNNEDTGLKP